MQLPRRAAASIQRSACVTPNSKSRAWLKRAALSEDKVRELVQQNTNGRDLGVFGDPGVNVLQLNLALDQQH